MSDKVSMVDCDCGWTGCPHVHQLNENGQWTIRESLGWMSRRSPNDHLSPNRKPEQATSSPLVGRDESSWTVSDSCDRTKSRKNFCHLAETLMKHFPNAQNSETINFCCRLSHTKLSSARLASQNDKNDSSAQRFSLLIPLANAPTRLG